MKRLGLACAAREGDYLTIIQHTDTSEPYDIIVRSGGDYRTRGIEPEQALWLGEELLQASRGISARERESGPHYIDGVAVGTCAPLADEVGYRIVVEGSTIVATAPALVALARELMTLVLETAYAAPYLPAVAVDGDQ